jgi:phosphopantetheinyl transferase
MNISISHSGVWVAVIFHPTQDVGIDIEIPTDKFSKLYQRFMNQEEQNTLFAGDDLRKVQLTWSAKEAMYKIIGPKAVDFANQLHIMPFELSEQGQFYCKHIPANNLYTLFYRQCKEFNLVYCMDNMVAK